MYCVAMDATEKKVLEKALAAERQHCYDLFSEAPLSMGVLSGQDHVLEIANPLFLQLIGKRNIIGKKVKDVLPETVGQGFLKLLDEVYNTGKAFSSSELHIQSDTHGTGQLVDKYLNFMFQAHCTEKKIIIGILFFAVDVTEQVISRKKNGENEARLNEAQALAKVGNWETNLLTEEVNWSVETFKIFEVDPANYMESHPVFMNYVHLADRDKVDKAIQNSFMSNVINKVEHRIKTPSGATKTVEERWRVVRDDIGNPIRAIGTCQDITERKKADYENEFKAKLLDTIGQAVIATDLNGEIIFWNRAAVDMYGWTLDEAIGKKISNLFPSTLTRVNAESLMKTMSEDESWAGEFYVKRKNGSEFPAFVFKSPFYDEFGKQSGIVGVSSDISERKEHELERSKITLDLIQRHRALEQFTYIISHNLRAPTANIMGLVDLLQNEKLTALERKECLRILSTSVLGLDTVIKDINYILGVQHEVNEDKERISFTTLVTDILNNKAELIDNNLVSIKSDFSQVDEIFSLKVYLQSIFYQLISNSIKYRKPDVCPVIEIMSRKEQEKIILVFRDNGLGIDLNTMGDKIFGLYKRFHTQAEGKGMGLFMVKTQVEALGGKISIASEVNKGTELTITFETPF